MFNAGVNRGRPREVVDWSNWSGTTLSTGDRIRDKEFVGSRWTGLYHGYQGDALEDVLISNCVFRWAEKWLSRAYRIRQIGIDRCEFMDVLTEHAIYWNVAGGMPEKHQQFGISMRIANSMFVNISSQAAQMVGAFGDNREAESSDPVGDQAPGLPVQLDGCYLENVGASTSHHRASFALSFAFIPNSVQIVDCNLNNAMQATSRGAILYQAPRSGQSIEVRGSSFNVGVLEQPMMKVESASEVILEDSDFIARGGQAWIDLNSCDSITVRNCSGNVTVRRNGETLGNISEVTLGG